MKKKSSPIFFLIFACLLSSCLNTDQNIKNELVSTKITPEQTQIEPSPTQNTILFTDDFSKTTSGWLTSSNGLGKADYADDGFEITSSMPGSVVQSTNSQTFSDAIIEFDIQATDATIKNTNAYGGSCRVQENGDGYQFLISSDGEFGIQKVQNGKRMTLHPWIRNLSVNTGDQVNHLAILCQGEQFEFWINNKLVGYATDSSFLTGKIGLLGVTLEDKVSTEIKVSNFTVLNPVFDERNINSADSQKLTIKNTTKETACIVRLGDHNGKSWNQNLLLDGDTLTPGETRNFNVYIPAKYNIEVDTCDFNRLFAKRDLDLTQNQTTSLIQPDLITSWEFSEPDRAWILGYTHAGQFLYETSGFLTMKLQRPNQLVEISSNDYKQTDAIVKTKTDYISSFGYGELFGPMCRIQTDGSGILFAINSEGQASIMWARDGYYVPLTDWEDNPQIVTGFNTNIIEGDCIGDTYTMYVNGSFIAKTTYDKYTDGKVGVGGATFGGLGTEGQVNFDYLQVYSPYLGN